MRLRTLAAALLLACACAPAAAAQSAVLRPGSAQVSGAAIPARVEEFDIYVGDEGGVRVGSMTLRTRLVTMDGTPAIARTETTWMDDELVQVDSFALHRQTLAPLAMWSSMTEAGVSLRFSPGRVVQVDDGDWGADTAEVPLPEPVFLSGTTDMLLGALPLAPGYAATLATYDEDAGPGVMEVRVEAEEALRLPDGGSVSAWRVRVDEDGEATTYWMDRESHTLVQFEADGGALRIVRSRASRSRARPTR